MSTTNKQLYYRLIALWSVCEGFLGGIIHGFNLPISGLIVGSGAVIIVCLIGHYVPSKGAIIRATIIVAIFKMMLSPQSPAPAYVAVFFQGITGELFFFNKRFYKISCIVFAAIALFESGIQRIIVMTVLYGSNFWKAVNDFINGLTHQQNITNYSLYLAGGYVAAHIVAGIFVGAFAARIPTRIKDWRKEFQLPDRENETEQTSVQYKSRHKRKRVLFIIWILLAILWVQSEFHIGKPLLSSNTVLHILLRSLLIVLTWVFLVSPVITFLLKKWLLSQQSKLKSTVSEILMLLPSTQSVLQRSWDFSADKRGFRRFDKFLKTVLATSLDESHE